MEQDASSAPALARGIQLLEQLAVDGQMSLEQLAAKYNWPKSSVLRCLQTLESLGIVFQHPKTKHWSALRRLCSIEPKLDDGIKRLRDHLPGLANASGHCVEFYLVKDEGLFLFDRADPEMGEVTVQARIGYYRALIELDATSQITYAFSERHSPSTKMWVWSKGKKKMLSANERDTTIQVAHSNGLGVDSDFNESGIRRFAIPVFSEQRLDGVLAIAQRQTPRAESEVAKIRKLLSQIQTHYHT